MKLVVNGEPTDVEPGATVADIVARLGHAPEGRGIAVAVNGEVVARGEWGATPVGERDRIEVLNAVGGG